MLFLDDLTRFAHLMIESNRFGRLVMMSDRELSARGIDRESLLQGYMRAIRAR